MAKLSKRVKSFREKVSKASAYPLEDAISILKEHSKVKFPESMDAAIILGVDPRKSDQVVRGATLLPHGSGRDVVVAVLCQGQQAENAKEAGAEVVGFEDLADEIKRKASSGEKLGFDVLIA